MTETCCQIDLLKLFKHGFQAGHGCIREPTSITSAAALACIAIQASQNDMHGGQAVPHFDFCMAPYVNKTFQKEYKDAFTEYLVIQGEGISSRGTCERDAQRYFDELPTLSNTEKRFEQRGLYAVGILAEAHEYAIERATTRTDRACYQAMEALIHNLNTMHSRAGAQVPFSSLNYGTDTSWQGRMVIKNLLLATEAGLGAGETPIFPVQIFKVKDGVNYEPETPNHDLFQLAIKVTSKRLFPNFSFLDAPFNKAFYTQPGDWNHEVAYMG